ncbi:hypothetical protein EDM54_24390 [Brevibacillus borstelensis]|uniref:hypothetical protein n=1 Tax=Brevibacillus borstelensis TaxID=45462 RepID=UPI000F095300|nr:hypothetical protein EDM54_24390 [Brevibacillus borstelensis]GED55803.1 hypothetical protein BBO01nite_50440 [Brevibacillus borstelensis]
MPYQAKTDWNYNDPVTEHDINRWEKGIVDAHISIEQLSVDVSNLRIRMTTLESILPENFLYNKFDDDLSTVNSIRVIRGYYNEAASRLEV